MGSQNINPADFTMDSTAFNAAGKLMKVLEANLPELEVEFLKREEKRYPVVDGDLLPVQSLVETYRTLRSIRKLVQPL